MPPLQKQSPRLSLMAPGQLVSQSSLRVPTFGPLQYRQRNFDSAKQDILREKSHTIQSRPNIGEVDLDIVNFTHDDDFIDALSP